MPKVFPGYKEEARSRVIQAAAGVFAEKGYHATSMDDIAKELGVSRGALYQYFRNKEDILQEIFLLNQQRMRDWLERYGDDADLLSIAERMFDEVIVEKAAIMPIHFEVISLASHDEAIRKVIFENNKKDVAGVEAFIQKNIKKGNIRKDVDPAILAHILNSLYLRTVEKLIFGVDSAEVKRIWLESLKIVLGAGKGK